MLGHKSFLRMLSVGILSLILLLSASTAKPIQAGTPVPPLPAGFENWSGNFTLRSAVPFVWVRATPSSIGQVITTVYPSSVFAASATAGGATFSWDGVQWWGYVVLPTTTITGWVEIGSLQRIVVNGPTNTPQPQTSPRGSWTTATTLRVKSRVPFVWLRAAPNSYAGVLLTVASGISLTVANDNAVLDGQWWWLVKHPGSGVTGWVEQASLELSTGPAPTTPPPAAQAWDIGAKIRIRPTIPFSWLRYTASSWAAAIYTAVSGQQLEVVAVPQFDGIQWWWQVKVPDTQITGWVEQNSLALAPVRTNTPNPPPTLAPNEYTTVQQPAAFEQFEHGFMIWLSGDETIYVLLVPGRQVVKSQFTYQWFEYTRADYASLADNPIADQAPSGMTKPIRGFGKVWGNFKEVRDLLGWGSAPEQGYTTTMKFPKALLRYFVMTLPDNREVILFKRTASQLWQYQTP